MGLLHYTNTFYSRASQEWTIEIYGVTDSSGTGADFESAKSGFSLTYQKGTHLRLPLIMPSTLSVHFLVTSDTEKNSISTFLAAQEGAYYIKVIRGSALYWIGYLKPSFDTYPDMPYPYTTTLKATDSLGRLRDKFNVSSVISSSIDYRKLSYPFEIFNDLYDLDDLIGASEYKYNFLYNWWHENQTYDANNDPIQEQYYNRASFIEDNATWSLQIKNYISELNGLAKVMGCRVVFANGQYWIMQENMLDSDTIDYWTYKNPLDTSTALKVTGGSNFVTIDNDQTAINSTYANIVNGSTFTLDPELNSVRVNFRHGTGAVVFDNSGTYTALSTIGLIGNATLNYIFHPNLIASETFSSGSVTPVANQTSRMSCIFTCKLKVGIYYFTYNGWTTTDSTFQLRVGWGTESANVYQGTTYTNYIGYGVAGDDVAHAKAIDGFMLEPLPAYGEAQFMFTPAFYYWKTDAPPITLDELIAAGTTYQNTSYNGVTPSATSQGLGDMPHLTNMQAAFGSGGNATFGSQYISMQNPSTAQPDLDLKDVFLGTQIETNDISLGSLAYLDSGTGYYTNAGKFRRGNSGTYILPTILLAKEYLQGQDKPLAILQATIRNNLYTPRMVLKYEDEIGGSTERYAFLNGTFNAAKDEWSGSWVKLDITSSPSYTDTTDEFTDPYGDEGDPIAPPPPPNNFSVAGKANIFNSNLSNVVGSVTTAITGGAATDKIFITAATCVLKDDQKLLLTYPDGTHPLVIKIDGGESLDSTDINIDSVTPAITYPIGSQLVLRANDFNNLIFNDDGNLIGTNLGVIYNLEMYLTPLDFKISSGYRNPPYTDDDGATLRPSSSGVNYYATFQVPIGYKATKVDLKCSSNDTFEVLFGAYDTDGTSSAGTGTTNTELTLTSAFNGAVGRYAIIKFDPSATTDEIYGCKITLERV